MPTDQTPLFHLPGPHGGWFASLLYGYPSVDVPMQELRELVAGSRGEVIVARRLTHEEAGEVENSRIQSDSGVHAGLIAKEEKRFRRPRRKDKHGRKRRQSNVEHLVEAGKLAVRAVSTSGEIKDRVRRRRGA